ncbi:MAG: pullulanase-type alpha-1,6-glucosidase [Steroidobacteraceae bacterium]
MSRSLRELLKFSVPLVASAALLSGCGSGSGGSADLDDGGSTNSPPPPVTVTETFNFKATADWFVVGTPPVHARFSGGEATGNGAWIIPEGQTGVVDFGTPADAVKFSTQDDFTAAAALAAQKATPLPRAPEKPADPPFDVSMYVRGSVRGDWAVLPENQLQETAVNVFEVTMPLAAGDYQFKVADASWTGLTNCGADTDPTPVTVGAAFTMQCDALSQNLLLTIAAADDYKFTFNATGADKTAPTITVARVIPDDPGGGGEEPEDSTEIRIYAVDVLTAGATPTLLKTVKGIGRLDVDELRQGGATRITRIEIENKGTAGDVGVTDFAWTASPRFALAKQNVDIYYSRPTGGVTGTTITVGGTVYQCAPTTDAFGCVARNVPVTPYANLNMTVDNADGSSESILFNGGSGTEEVYAFSGSTIARSGTPGDPTKALPALPRNENEVILFYKRADDVYTGWGVHLFPTDPAGDAWTTWEAPFPYEGVDPQYGAYFRIALPGEESPAYSANPPDSDTFPTALGFIIHKADVKDPGPDQVIRVAQDGNIVFVVSGVNDVSPVPPSGGTTLRVAGAAAHWVDSDTVLWTPDASVTKVELLYSPDASINAGLQGITGTFETIALTSGTNPQPAFNQTLNSLEAWTLPAAAVSKAKDLARGQLIAIGRNADNEAVQGTLLQTAGALDDLYAAAAYGETLGVTYTSGTPSLAVWAPTALEDPGLSVNIYDAAGTKLETVPMSLDESTGIWSVTGDSNWDRKFYTITLQVYSYATDSIVTNEVTDPYSVSLATDSVRSQFVNLDDADLKPAGWDSLEAPPLAAPEDSVVYELHVRDFSVADSSVPAADRGKYTAFDIPGTAGRNHLQELASAGLTHVHILPAFDFATVPEDAADRVELDDPVEDLCARVAAAVSLCATDAGKTIRQAMRDAVAANQLDRPQQITEWMRGIDGFNWGYDPLHFGAPEGSYATDPNGAARILEFRRMVKGLNDIGLRTVMDVVYNHTNASGQNGRATLDRLVPGYYHRRENASGNVLKDSCCDDTAAEFKMMEKLMIDTGVTWVRDYKVSGFRFDIMTFHPLSSMQNFQAAVKAIDPSVYIYGEGWNFGAVQNDARFLTARQANLGGTGIGSFSDRIRDPVRGGGPFDSGAAHVANQGFISGLFYAPNSSNSGAVAEREEMLADSDNIRVWLAGGLAGYRFTDATGATVSGADIDYGGQESGYTADPQEAVNYVSKHDNESLWDISQYKHATGTPLAARVRADNVGMSVVMLAQGIPFLQAGTEILRSKSMDRNSYDSGDWYNEIDWTLATSKWNVGLPREADNAGNYPQVQNVILDVTAAQDQAAREAALANFKELLAIRKSSPLFRLRSQAQVDQRLKFYNTGPFQIPGVIAMSIDGCTEPGLEPDEGALMAIFNASDDPRTIELFTGEAWDLHPVQATSADAVVRTAKHDANGFFVPARTTAVFRRATQTSCAPYPRDLYVRGGFNDWGNPTPTEPYKLVFLGGTGYSVSAPVAAAGSYEFKIADAGWTADTNCGSVSGTVGVRLGIPLTLMCASNSGNLALTAPTAGDYTFALDAASTASPVLTVTKSPPTPLTLFVRGGFTDWGTSLPLAWDGISTYRATAAIAGGNVGTGLQFKIADNDWGNTTGGATNCGGATAGTTVTIGTPYALSCFTTSENMGITFPSEGSYLFAIDWSTPASPQLTVEKYILEAPLFVRGLGGDWSDGPQNLMSYLGGGVYSVNKAVAALATSFKIATSDWTTLDCGASSAGTTITVGTPSIFACGSGTSDVGITPPAAGTYTFEFRRIEAASGEVTVTGP